jgi:2-oxoisovalerate dehydrogenase E2 component (dihydrolipoyl transacylase)
MARYEFKLPDIGEGIAEAEIVAWHVKVGDRVEEDQQLADMMTDKATVEMESPVAGKVVELAGEVGDQIPIGSVLVVIETEAGAAAAGGAPPAREQDGTETDAEPASAPTRRLGTTARCADRRGAGRGGPERRKSRRKRERLPKREEPSERRSRAPPASRALEQRRDFASASANEAGGAKSQGPRLPRRPPARPRPRHRPRAGEAPRRPHPPRRPRRLPPLQWRLRLPAAARARAQDETIKVVGLRRKIAENMQEAKRRIPHFTLVEEFDVTALEQTRAMMNRTAAAIPSSPCCRS